MDSLKDRLNSHSNSFESLLSLIPARYYYDDETNEQWKKRGMKQSEKKAVAQNLKNAKFDPEVGASALDEIRRRQAAVGGNPSDKKEQKEAPQDEVSPEEEVESDEEVVVYDESGNAIGDKEESVADILRAKRLNPDPPSTLSSTASKAASKAANKAGNKSPTKAGKPRAKNSHTDATKGATKVAAKEPKLQAEPEKKKEAENENETIPEEKEEPVDEAETVPKPKIKIEELRKKLADRIADMRKQRKAPGSGVEGAPKNREMLLEARKRKLEAKKQRQKQLQKEKESGNADEGNGETAADGADVASANVVDSSAAATEDSLSFAVSFSDGSVLRDSGFEQQRNIKKRNAADQLRTMEERRKKIAALDPEKQKQIAENSKWSRAILQSEGAKLKDDEKLLRKTIKQKRNKKHTSEKLWKQRLDNVKRGISGREAKRDLNIKAHKEAKRLHLKGKKRKMHMKAAVGK